MPCGRITDMRLPSLRKEAQQSAKEFEPDHLELARQTVKSIGSENVLYADNSFWIWGNTGVWNKRPDIELKRLIQSTLESGGHVVTAPRIGGVADVLRSECYISGHSFNQGNPDVINCTNGELELIDGKWTLVSHRREHYRTTQIPVDYNPNATAPQFVQFLHDVFRDDFDRDCKIQSVCEMIGYTLLAHSKHEKFAMLIGTGANGKSVLLSIVEALCGERNVAGVQPANFNSRFQRAHLHMKLANIVTELKQGEIIADAELKAITSGEISTVEHKNADPFNMRAFSTCWFGTNHLPHTRDFSDALFRRAIILPFNRKFSEAEQDRDLKRKLTKELPGILNWAIHYYSQAQTNGLIDPPSSMEAKRHWRIEADQVAQFVEEKCEADATARLAIGEIYREFDIWARQSGIRQIVGKQAMGDRLERLGFKRVRSNGSHVDGLKLRQF